MADTLSIETAGSENTGNISESSVKPNDLEELEGQDVLDYNVRQVGSDTEMCEEESRSRQCAEDGDVSIQSETSFDYDNAKHDSSVSVEGGGVSSDDDDDDDDDDSQSNMIKMRSGEELDCRVADGLRTSPVGDTASLMQDYRSQYHSILQLSVPASSQTGNNFNNVSNMSSATTPSAYDFSFSMKSYCNDPRPYQTGRSRLPEGDSLQLLRNLRHSNLGEFCTNSSPNVERWNSGSPLALCRSKDKRGEMEINGGENDKPVDMTGYDATQRDDYDDSLLRSPSDLSLSSRADLSEDDEAKDVTNVGDSQRRKSRKHKASPEDAREFDMESCGMNDDSASLSDDQGSSGDVVEAKRARMEAIVSSMRFPASDSTSSHLENSVKSLMSMNQNDRRARRKQHAPRQRDVSASRGEETAASNVQGEKHCLQQELRHMQDQLAEMKQKYSQLLHKKSTTKNSKKSDSIFEHRLEEEQRRDLSRRIQESACDLVNRQFSQSWLTLTKDINCNGGDYGKSSPVGGSTPLDVEHLSGMLKAEIASSVGSLVDEIVKNFVKKHKLGKDYLEEDDKNQSPSKTSDIGDISDDDTEQREFSNESTTEVKEEEEQLPTHEMTSQVPSSLFLPQPIPPAMAQILAGFNEYSMMNRFGCFQKSFGKSAERFVPPFMEQHLQKSAFELPRPAGIPLFPTHPFFSNPSLSTPAGAAAAAACLFPREPEQTEALPLVVSAPAKKKRTKVTDTRLSPRAARAILQDSVPHAAHQGTSVSGRPDLSSSGRNEPIIGDHVINESTMPSSADYSRLMPSHYPSQPHQPLLPASLPTSVAVPNPSLQHSNILQAIYSRHQQQQRHQLDLAIKHHQMMGGDTSGRSSRSSSPGEGLSGGVEKMRGSIGGGSDGYSGGFRGRTDQLNSSDYSAELTGYDDQALTSTLTPVHLRKAKLMFFYVRYPSSAVIKTFFPDVKFNKNNTAQLIKWFSNFREFYYIQMEKYARQALTDGIKSPMDIIIGSESELYRVLVLHYNRNNQIEVPDNFRMTVQATLREFFKSIQAERDQEPSWKKAIYKIIARLDDNVPEYFKSTNWMEQLVDG